VEACIAADLVAGEGFAVDASLIQADANKQRSMRTVDVDILTKLALDSKCLHVL
jgi:hypothetical protein